jgi:hypothetical protein
MNLRFMRSLRKNKFLWIFLFLAVFGFAGFSIGGEYLHDCVHHHETKSSHDRCPVYLLQAQVLTALSIICALLFLKVSRTQFGFNSQIFFFHPDFLLPEFRGPPVLIIS